METERRIEWKLRGRALFRWIVVAVVTVQRRLGRRKHPPGRFTTASARGNTYQGWSVGLEKSETAILGGLQVASPRTESESRWLAAELRQALKGDDAKYRGAVNEARV